MVPPEDIKAELVALLPRLQRYARSLTHSRHEADDLLQATCVRALDKWRQFKPGSNFDRWVFTIMSSVRSNYLRSSARRQGSGELDAEAVLIADESGSPEQNKYFEQIIGGVLDLPVAQKQTLLLVYVEGFTYQEAADILSIPVGTVMSRIGRARASLSSSFSAGSSGEVTANRGAGSMGRSGL